MAIRIKMTRHRKKGSEKMQVERILKEIGVYFRHGVLVISLFSSEFEHPSKPLSVQQYRLQ